jgi:cytochrome c oxidase cbb3-type subunit 4
MELTHEWFVGFSKSFGLFYLIALSIGITAYAYWPSLGRRFDKAANSILADEDGPAQDGRTHAEDMPCQ